MYMFGTSKATYLCEACGKASRGRHKLQRPHQYHAGFACALGTGQYSEWDGSFSETLNPQDGKNFSSKQ